MTSYTIDGVEVTRMEIKMIQKNTRRLPATALHAWPVALLLSCALVTAAHSHTPAATKPTKPAATKPAAAKAQPRPAPGFTLPGTDGKTHSLAQHRGRCVALFFYCGCRWCHQSAQAWGTVQRSGTL